MNIKTKTFIRAFFAAVILLVNFGSMPGIVYAEEGDGVIDITVDHEILFCNEVTLTISLDDLTVPYQYQLEIDYGDGGPIESKDLDSAEVTLIHTYSEYGVYDLTITVTESVVGGLTGMTSSVITIDVPPPPAVTLNSTPFPPLVVLGVDTGLIDFSAEVTGGTLPYTYAWDAPLVVGITPDTASSIFTVAGKYQALVTVTDINGCIASDTLPVVVSDPGDMCHPTAQKIADAVNTIFPAQAGDLYTCEEIYDIFDGDPEGSNVGFGGMWKAYNLALTMEELTWEEIRDWHLDTGGWGALLQLDRFSELLETHSLPDLMGLVMSEEYSLGDVRTAARSTTRYEADFDDALSRIADGATAGELGQFYNLVGDLEADPAQLDAYLAKGMTLSEIKHTANYAYRMETNWTEIAEFRLAADSWGDISQAYKLATDEISAEEILARGIQEYRKDLQEADQEERTEQKATQQEERVEQKATQQEDKNQQTAEKLAEQFNVDHGVIEGMFGVGGICEGDWGCVRNALREQEQEMTQAEGELSERDTQTASQIASKYSSTPEEVLDYHNTSCGGDWACTRAYFRELSKSTKETGKPDK